MASDLADTPISDTEADTLFGLLACEPALVLAVSGGPDSTALLYLAARWRKRLKRAPKLVAVTIDHGLRKESSREALAVNRLAAKLKVEHRTLRWTGAKPKSGIQEAARDARYLLLARAAKRAGAKHVVTAHTQDDQAETVLFRMMRGSGVGGLIGMGEDSFLPGPWNCSYHLSRPFLRVPKARLLATLAAGNIAYAVDPSNADPKFTRPRLRALMPALASEGLTAERLARLARRIRRADLALDSAVNDAQRTICPGGRLRHGTPVTVDILAFLTPPEEIQLRLLGRMIQVSGGAGVAGLGQLEVLNDLVREAGMPVWSGKPTRRFRRTLAGAMVTLSGTKLTVERAPPRRTGAKKLLSP